MSESIAKTRDRTVYPESPIPAVAVVVRRNRDEFLMIQRGKEPRKGTWTVPGGSIELGETLKEAAEREVREETGLSVRALRAFGAIDAIYRDSKGRLEFHYVIIYMEAEYLGGEPAAGDDAMSVRWIRGDEIRAGFADAEPGTLRIIKEEFGL